MANRKRMTSFDDAVKRLWKGKTAKVVIIVGRRLVDILFDDMAKDYVEVFFIGDIHYGADIDESMLRRHLEEAKRRGAYIILMGDMIENANRDSVGAGVYDQRLMPQSQIDGIVGMLEPYKDQILYVLEGNHESRSYKRTGVDVAKTIADRLGVKYAGYETPARLKVGRKEFYIYTTHGASGATTKAGKLRAMHRLGDIYPTFDGIFMGHTHDLIHDSRIRYRPSKSGKTLQEFEQHYFNTGHYLRYGGYAAQKGYAPGKTGCWSVRFHMDGRITYEEHR